MHHTHVLLVSFFRRSKGETWEPQKEAKLFRISESLGQKYTFTFSFLVSSDLLSCVSSSLSLDLLRHKRRCVAREKKFEQYFTTLTAQNLVIWDTMTSRLVFGGIGPVLDYPENLRRNLFRMVDTRTQIHTASNPHQHGCRHSTCTSCVFSKVKAWRKRGRSCKSFLLVS